MAVKLHLKSDFVQAVGAQHAVFMVGYLNRFKHPKPLIKTI